ncbi:Alkaline phosphatase precursor [Planctomycetes bacterium MalM25]|nr:Alkaline phosphatase precursor [Planctomycetes bacterium MalM25]
MLDSLRIRYSSAARCFILFTSVAVLPCHAAELARGPYLQLATPSSTTVVWRANEAMNPVVRYGESPDRLDRSVQQGAIVMKVSTDLAAETPAPFDETKILFDEPAATGRLRKTGDRDPSTAPRTRQFEAKIEGLQPATRYYYAIENDGDRLAGGDERHHFETLPAADALTDLRLWVVGDSGTGGVDQRRVFEAMNDYCLTDERRPDAFIHVGDMAYGDGADSEFQHNFFEVYQSLLRNTVCWPALGNHEGHTSRGVSQFGPYFDAYVVPTAAEAGGVASGTEAYYSFDIGRVHFICLDSHDLDRTPDGAMAEWLVADLEETKAEWLIAFWHHPPYTKGSHDSDRERQLIEMRTYLMPLLESGGVDLVLSGHSHIYERSMLIDGAYATPTTAEGVVLDDGDGHPEGDGPYRKSFGLTPHNGTVAIVTGHGGAGVSRKGTMPVMREIIVDHGSLLVDLRGETLTGTMIDKRGAERDVFRIVKRGEVDHEPIVEPWQPFHDPNQITETPIVWSEREAGSPPPDWTTILGRSDQMRVELREGTPYYQVAIRPKNQPLLAVYDGFEDRVSELQAWVEPVGEGQTAVGLVLAWQDAKNYASFTIDAPQGKALFSLVRDGRRRVISERKIELVPNRPVKIELEPVQRIVEIQINDELEYTVNLEKGLASGRVGVESLGGSVNVAGVTIERMR